MSVQKFLFTLLLLAGCGAGLCSADTPAIPDLVGNWTGSAVGHDRIGGYDTAPDYHFLLSVTEQKGRAFNGTFFITNQSDPGSGADVGFSGVIGADMNSFYLSEYNNGLNFGEIIDPNTLEIVYLQTGAQASAAVDTFTRERRS